MRAFPPAEACRGSVVTFVPILVVDNATRVRVTGESGVGANGRANDGDGEPVCVRNQSLRRSHSLGYTLESFIGSHRNDAVGRQEGARAAVVAAAKVEDFDAAAELGIDA